MNLPENRRILIVDDNPAIHEDFRKVLAPKATGPGSAAAGLDALENLLTGGTPSVAQAIASKDTYEMSHALQGEQGFELVQRAVGEGTNYCAAFVDMRMPPGWDGLETIKAMRQADPGLTIVVCTAYSDHRWEDIEKVAQTADRLLILKKPFDPIEVRSICRLVTERWKLERQAKVRSEELQSLVRLRTAELEKERARDHERMGALEEIVEQRTVELKRAALHDKLTGLPNRAMFFDRLQESIRRSLADPSYHYAVLFLDFDRFKVINDSLGHDAGDQLLVEIGRRLTSALRPTDVVGMGRQGAGPRDAALAARLGGDEFSVLLENLVSPADAEEVAKRLLAALCVPYDIAGREVNSSASIGITLSSVGYTVAEDVLRDADTAMYRAKGAGRGGYCLFKPRMHEEAMRRLVFENDLRRAMERNELELYFQPIVSLTQGSVVGAEGLLRWNHAERGRILPGEFIALAEETGMILDIGKWALKEACQKIKVLGDRLSYVSVNVSRRQVIEPGFMDMFDEVLAETGVDPTKLVMELTESALTHDADLAERVIAAIRTRKARVYLDDFGTGLSSLGSIRRFSVDGLKLDRSFLDPAVFSRRTAAVIHTGITLAKDLQIELIAEGIETLEQMALLQTLGCELAQGYLFSRPVNLATLLEVIDGRQRAAAAAA